MDENLLALLGSGLTAGATKGLSGGSSNATLATLLGGSDLGQFAQQARANNIYSQLLPVVTGTQFDRTGWDVGTSAGVSAGQAFLAGLLGNTANRQVADQVKSVSEILPALYDNPGSVELPEGIDAAAGEQLKAAAMIKKLQQQAVEQTKGQDMVRKLMEDVYGTDINALKVAKETKAKIGAENEAYGYSPTGEPGSATNLNPNSPQYKVDKDQTERIVNLRKEFNALEPVKNFAKASQAATALSGALKDNSSVSDQELVRYSILMIEPGMAVREGEQNAVAASQSIPAEWKGWLSKSLEGGTALSPDVREGIKRLAQRAYGSHKGLYDQSLGLYTKEAELQGLDPSRLSYIGEAPDAESIFGASTGGSTKTINGVTYKKVNGGWQRAN